MNLKQNKGNFWTMRRVESIETRPPPFALEACDLYANGILSESDDDSLFDDDLLFDDGESDETDSVEAGVGTKSWEILIVDDDESILQVTQLALRGFHVGGQPVRVFTASSFTDAREFLRSNTSMAVVVTDVVMESDRAGIELVEWVRHQSMLDPVRLVIRTGEPGAAPPEQVLNTLDINDYWPKTEISPHRMRTILTGLVRSFRDICELQAQKKLLEVIQARLIKQEQLKVLGELASGVVHDFRNVLTPITAYSSMLNSMPDLSEADKSEFASLIFQASLDAATIVERLQRDYLGKNGTDDRCLVDVDVMLSDTVALARPKLNERCKALGACIELDAECKPNVKLVGNAGELRQGLLNLTMNALDAMESSGTIRLLAFDDDGDTVLQVIDSGCGMDENTLCLLYTSPSPRD